MKPSSFIRIAGLCVLGAVSMPLSRAMAQPNTVAPAPMVPIRTRQDISVVATKLGIGMSLNVQNADVLDTLIEIVRRGNLEVIVRGKIAGTASLSAQGDPQDVLQTFCKTAHLSCRKVAGAWIIGESIGEPVVPIGENLTLSFQDIGVRDLVEFIAQNFHLVVKISPDVKGSIALIYLSGLSPRESLKQVAVAADLDMVEKDNVLMFSSKQPATK